MTEEQPEKKKSRKRKTGAGAWWKNVLPDTEESAETSPVENVASELPESSLSTQDRSGDVEFPAQSVVMESAGEGGEATEQNEKKPRSRKRSTRNRRVKKDVESTGSEQAVDEQVKEISQEDSDGTVSPENEMEATAPPVETVVKTSKRSRRRKKRTAKPADEDQALQEQPAETSSEEFWDAPQDSAESFANEMVSGKALLDELAHDEELDEESDDFLDQELVLLDESPEEAKKPVSKLLINAEEPEECRLALVENGKLQSIHVSTIARAQTKNNIYKARVVAIEPNLQAAFVDYGLEKNGFLPFNEIHPEYYKERLSEETQKLVDSHHWKKLSIVDVLEKGQELLVQVVKEEVGKKGANMTTYLSIPGRSVVLMPGSDSSGISRKIAGEERRSQLREAMNGLDIPEGIGWIVRTASVDITKHDLSRDVGYLIKLWDEIKSKGQELEGVGLLYEDHQSVLRFLREHFDPSIEEIQVDDPVAYDQVKKFISLLPENQQNVKVRLHKGTRPIFNQFSIEDQIESIYQPRVNLPSGGSIVIDPTEALVAIDVNSGSTSKGQNFEASIFQANIEAAAELARQLRLRDLGGLIVVDFIDMRNKKHIRDVEQMVKRSMKRDKAKVDVSRISKFGLMQISRQKLGAPIEAGNYRVCQHCKGRGIVRSVETLALFYLRRIQTGASRKNVNRIECHFPLDVASYLLNAKRKDVRELEERNGVDVLIVPEMSMKPAENDIIFHKSEKD